MLIRGARVSFRFCTKLALMSDFVRPFGTENAGKKVGKLLILQKNHSIANKLKNMPEICW